MDGFEEEEEEEEERDGGPNASLGLYMSLRAWGLGMVICFDTSGDEQSVA
jgi:hypothetical protein